MPGKDSKSTKKVHKKVAVPVNQLPETYNKLLEEYVALLQAEIINTYEFSISKRIRSYFNIKGQLDYATSSQINDFIKTPDALAQEIPAANEILKKLDSFDDQAVRAFAKLNSLNLGRIRRRSIKNQIAPGIAFTGSILGLLFDLQDILAISIKDSFGWLDGFNISLLLQWIIILIVVLAILIARINWMFITPRIGLVNAFGDILQILISHRNLKE